jgi:GMP synthase-like glutamine amidotransferase
MARVCILLHSSTHGPGYLMEVLSRRGMEMELLRVGSGQPLPATLDGIDGLVLLGASLSVHDPLLWMQQEVDLVRRAAGDMPVLGHGFGAELIAFALGAPWSATRSAESAGFWWSDMQAALQRIGWRGFLPLVRFSSGITRPSAFRKVRYLS